MIKSNETSRFCSTTPFTVKQRRNVRDRLHVNFMCNDGSGESNRVNRQNKIDLDGVEFYQVFSACFFRSRGILFNKPAELKFTFLESSKLNMFDTCFINYNFSFGLEEIRSRFIVCDSFVLNLNSSENFQNININLNEDKTKKVFDFSMQPNFPEL